MKEFNLSEKIEDIKYNRKDPDVIKVKDVKEFLRLLKEDVKDNFIGEKPKLITVDNVLCYIDKLAGPSLIELEGGNEDGKTKRNM